MILLQNLSKSFNVDSVEIPVLVDVSLNIRQNERICVVGPSGSGKTTLLDVIGTLLIPNSGKYLLDGYDLSDLDMPALSKLRARNFGFIFQAYNLLSDLSVWDNICLPLVYRKSYEKSKFYSEAERLLNEVGLSKYRGRLPSQLSGGQQQRVAIVRALAGSPKIVLADEPTGNLDSVSSANILDILFKFCENNSTLILVTHDKEISSRFERVIEMSDGRIVNRLAQ